MKPVEAYQNYLALKLHFTIDNYDVFKYNWQTKAANYTNRKDKYYFEKLARHPDPIGLMVANFLVKDFWIKDLFDQKHLDIYYEWKRRRESLTYVFKEEVSSLEKEDFIAEDGQHPGLMKRFLRRKVSPETMVILNRFIQYFTAWDKELKDDLIYHEMKRKIIKYEGFLKGYDKDKITLIMVEKFLDKAI